MRTRTLAVAAPRAGDDSAGGSEQADDDAAMISSPTAVNSWASAAAPGAGPPKLRDVLCFPRPNICDRLGECATGRSLDRSD